MGKLNITFEQFINDTSDYCIEDNYSIYMIKDMETILYIGMTTRNIYDRWFGYRGHMDSGSCVNYYSMIGQVVSANLPRSLQWTITMLTAKDAADLLGEKAPKVSNYDSKHSIEKHERYLIMEYNPLFNVSSRNRAPTNSEIQMIDKYLKGEQCADSNTD